jgi:N-acetylmuramoyl-L-alanine amidase
MSASANANPGLGPQRAASLPPPLLTPGPGPRGDEALQALLAFSSFHDQIRKEKAGAKPSERREIEKFALDEALQLVAQRALAMTRANGIAIALAEGDAIICRASAGEIAPDKRAKLNPNSGFSGACFRTGKVVRCDDTENDPRVNVQAARRLGTRSMVAVPLTGPQGTIGLMEAFSNRAYGFKDSSIRSLNLLAELILAALKPEEETRQVEGLMEIANSPEETTQQPQANHAISMPIEAAKQPWPQAPIEAAAPAVELPATASAPVEATEIYERLQTARLEAEPSRKQRSALKVALPLVVLAILAAAGISWKLLAKQVGHSGQNAVAPAVSTQTGQAGQSAGTLDANALEVSSPAKGDGLTAVTGIRHWASPDSSTIVVIDLQDQVQYEGHRLTDPDRIYFDLHDTVLPRALAGKVFEVGDPLLVRVRIAQPESGVTRVVLDTKSSPAYTVRLKSDPYRLEVQVHNAEAPAQPKAKVDLFGPTNQPLAAPARAAATTPAPVKQMPEEKAPFKTQAAAPSFRVALDAGHGGWDEGTIGRRGLMEKDLALDIVARLGKLVKDRLKAEVIYTRTEDTYIPLEKRAEIANLSQADFFVSVHANYSDLPSARGVETYYANSYLSLNARTPGADNAVQPVNWNNVDIREKAMQSQRLAASVQNSLYGRLAQQNPGLPNRGVKKASYIVLTGTTMPAILAEVSFVSSPTDEKSLKQAAYRQQIAEALYRGIAHFAVDQHKVTLASAGKPSHH